MNNSDKFKNFTKLLIIGEFYQYCSLKSNVIDFQNIFIGEQLYNRIIQDIPGKHGIIIGKTWKDGLLEEYLRNDLDKNILGNYL